MLYKLIYFITIENEVEDMEEEDETDDKEEDSLAIPEDWENLNALKKRNLLQTIVKWEGMPVSSCF